MVNEQMELKNHPTYSDIKSVLVYILNVKVTGIN